LDVTLNLLARLALLLVIVPNSALAADTMEAARLGVVFNRADVLSEQIARYYVAKRRVPEKNLVGLALPTVATLTPEAFAPLRLALLRQLPGNVQSLLLVWTQPFAVGCMSITTAMAAGYSADFCVSGCRKTPLNPLFDTLGWLPADTTGWWPAMLLPSDDPSLARQVIDRGAAADGTAGGVLYLMETDDAARNVRADTYANVARMLRARLTVKIGHASAQTRIDDAIGYFTGARQVDEIGQIRFRAGALADHLTSSGGVLVDGHQMPATAWLKQGATASYGMVSEPCNLPEKFPNIGVLFNHYTHGETALESYWKSVAMPGQGLIVGEPLSRPFGTPNP
jgi:uncharacterized protein (TIGR03790 family)